MTVHGAKGLEAPVVILADATADPAKLGRTPLTVDIEVEGTGMAPLLRPKKEERVAPFEEVIVAEEQRDAQEHLRLLYVAITRAADRLIVSGVMPKARKDGSDPRPPSSWHAIVERAMAPIAAPGEEHVSLRYGADGFTAAARLKKKIQPPAIAVPEWATQVAPPEARPPRPLAPSALAVDDETAPLPSVTMRAAALRGTWIHQLLERLPTVELSARAEAADRWLERSAGVTGREIRAEIVTQVCGILSDPRFAALFGPGSLAEAPLAATLPDGRVIAGTVDRILVQDSTVSVIDFKTGRVPATEADIPKAHRAQMSAYTEALQVIFPGRRVAASLLYTAGPKLIELMP
jgi:ATP-dependent exoDNAse (exonuclease V) beta subunit (contains helicase and exonuclease domains)